MELLEQPISYKQLEQLNLILTNNNPISFIQDIKKSIHSNKEVWRITGSMYNGKIWWQLPSLERQYVFDYEHETCVSRQEILYNALICYTIHNRLYKETNNGYMIDYRNLGKETIIKYVCAYLQRNISETSIHELRLIDLLRQVWNYYLDIQYKIFPQELFYRVFTQSQQNKPFDYLTNGIDIIEIYEKDYPF